MKCGFFGGRDLKCCYNIGAQLILPGEKMIKVLVVEDSPVFCNILRERITEVLDAECVCAGTLEDTVFFIKENGPFDAAVVDLNLPDAPDGEAVDVTTGAQIPTVVLTGNFDERTQARFTQMPIVDYFVKDRHGVDQTLRTIARVVKNPDRLILVADDSRVVRHLVTSMLNVQRYAVIEAENGREALKALEQNPGIEMLITDWEMPKMSGFELVERVRRDRQFDDLAIIGISSLDTPVPVSVKMLKVGADDFLHKPFHSEEFLCRVRSNLDRLEYVRMVRAAADIDHLTGLKNRLYLDRRGRKLFEDAIEHGKPVAVAIADIDNFKRINDERGHAAGDAVLRHVSGLMEALLAHASLVARFGGEEFLALFTGVPETIVKNSLEALRREIENSPTRYGESSIPATISLGAQYCPEPFDFEAMIKRADKLMYQAKNSGKNAVVFERSAT